MLYANILNLRNYDVSLDAVKKKKKTHNIIHY